MAFFDTTPQGRILNKTDPCNGFCFNDYSASLVLGFDSQFRCGDHCVPVRKMCRGYSQCEDNSDVTVCNENFSCLDYTGKLQKTKKANFLK